MGWAEIRQRMTDGVIATFAQTVTYTPKGGTAVDIETEFRARGHRVEFDSDGAPVESVRPRLLINASLVPGTLAERPRKGDTFTTDGRTYRVVEVEDTGAGYWQCWAVEVV